MVRVHQIPVKIQSQRIRRVSFPCPWALVVAVHFHCDMFVWPPNQSSQPVSLSLPLQWYLHWIHTECGTTQLVCSHACLHSLGQHPAFCTLPRRIHTNHNSENELRNKLTDQQISYKMIGIRGCSCKSLDTSSREPAVMQGEKHPQPFRLARPLILNATMDYYELWLWVDEMLHFRWKNREANVIKTIQFPNLYLFLEQWSILTGLHYPTIQRISGSDRRPETILDRSIYEIKSGIKLWKSGFGNLRYEMAVKRRGTLSGILVKRYLIDRVSNSNKIEEAIN